MNKRVKTDFLFAQPSLASGAARVLDLYPSHRGIVGNKHLVPRLLAEMDHHRRLDVQLAHPAAALHGDAPAE